MDEHLLKQWKALEGLLEAAASEISDSDDYVEYKNYVDHNEFELALDVLEDAGKTKNMSSQYWLNLMEAAKIMRLFDRYAALRSKCL